MTTASDIAATPLRRPRSIFGSSVGDPVEWCDGYACAAAPGTAEHAALWFRKIGLESGFYRSITACIAGSMVGYLWMPDTRRHSRIGADPWGASWRTIAMRRREVRCASRMEAQGTARQGAPYGAGSRVGSGTRHRSMCPAGSE